MAGTSKWANIQQRKRKQDALRGRTVAPAGDAGHASLEQARFEGYAPGGVAVIVDCLTDNHARTAAELGDAFTKFGGNLAVEGSVAPMFKALGLLSFAPGTDEQRLAALALEAGADDVLRHAGDDSIDVLTALDVIDAVRHQLESAGFTPDHAETTLRADIDVGVSGDTAKQVVELIRYLESRDDVQTVYTNAELSADAYA